LKDNILADTSVWIEFFKLRSATGDALEKMIKEHLVWTCGIVLFELIKGVKSEAEKITILDTLLSLEYIEMSPLLWKSTGEIAASLKKEGKNLPMSDIFIAALAIRHNLQIFTLDKHFEQIPGVRVYKR
jgi:predicted nucleic acid-binding protein